MPVTKIHILRMPGKTLLKTRTMPVIKLTKTEIKLNQLNADKSLITKRITFIENGLKGSRYTAKAKVMLKTKLKNLLNNKSDILNKIQKLQMK